MTNYGDSSLASEEGAVSTLSRRRASAASVSTQLDSPLQPPLLGKLPNSLSPSTMSPGGSSVVGTQDKPKQPFKSKSKHNLAIFGAKLSSTAASVGVHTSKYKQQQRDLKEQQKEAHRESVFVEMPESHPFDPSAIINSPLSMSPRAMAWGTGDGSFDGSIYSPVGSGIPDVSGGSNGVGSGSGGSNGVGGSNGGSGSAGNNGGLKSKMFKQSKSDLKSLKIKTDLGIHAARSSLNDRSPMSRGGSNRELDRIAALGQQPNSPVHPGDFNFGSNSGHYHLHPPHLSFRKRDSPAAVLSSSASNSTLASEGTVYSFNQTNGTGASSVASASHHSFKSSEEATAFLTSSWTLLNLRIQPVFKRDEALRIPVEDVNILVFMHFTAHHEQGGSGIELLGKIDELLQTGLQSSSSVLPTKPTLDGLAESWQYFYGKTLLTLEAIFLPLQLELDGMGQVFTTARAASEYWFPLMNHRSSAFNKSNASRRRAQKPNIRKRVLTVYRNQGVLPILTDIKRLLTEWEATGAINPDAIPSSETLAHLLQCFTTLSHLKTADESQTAIDDVLALLSKNTSRRFKHTQFAAP